MVKLPHILKGKYLLKVDALKLVSSRKGIQYTCAEFTVLKSMLPGGNPESTRCSLMINMSLDTAQSNSKNLFAAVLGESEDKVTEQAANTLVSVKNPAAGRTVEAEATDIITRAGKPFTQIRFYSVKK
jgi:hypothetical protein